MKAKRLLSLLTATFVIIGSIGTVYGQTLHEQTKVQTVTMGVEHIATQRLTSKGWQDINILKVDLNNENVILKPLESKTLGEKKTVLQMAQENNAVGGVNADFFDMSSAVAPSFGPVVQQGEMKHSYNSNYTDLGPKKYMATFMVDASDNLLMNYYSMCMQMNVEGSKLFDIGSYNTLSGSFNLPIVIDSRYYENTAKLNNKYRTQGVYTVVVTDDVVAYVSLQNEVVSIPPNSYAIVMNNQSAVKYLPQLSIGSNVQLQQTVQLKGEVVETIENMNFGIGGGGLIMKDGQPYSGQAHKVSGQSKEPRTILATTHKEGEVLLIAIDGRNKTLGANHSDLTEILQGYGVKDAMYLDGGGSTTLVARDEAQSEVKVKNTPSEGSQRKVTNGIGVFTTSPTSELNKLYIEPNRNRTFVGEGITFKLKGVDKNYNAVTVGEAIQFNVTGVTGTWKGFTFYPSTAGKALVIATKDGVESVTEINVSSAPCALRIEPSYLQLDENTSKTIQLYGVDQEGYKIPISTDKVIWTSDNNKVKGQGNQIIATSKTLAMLSAKYKNIEATIGVVVGTTVTSLDSFEEANAVWAGNTTTVKGKVEPSKDIKYHGKQSMKMTYTFDKSSNKQVAYTVFNKPSKVPIDANAINLWVYAKAQGDALKIQIKDAIGQTHYLKLSDSLTHEGWKYFTATIPETVKLPAQIDKIYTYANTNPQKRTSSLYIDHMSITRGYQDKEGIAIRNDYTFDTLYKPTLQAATSNQYEIHITGPTKVESMNLSKETIDTMTNRLQTHADLLIMASPSNIEMPFTQKAYTYQNAYAQVEHSTTKVLFVGTNNGGIRATAAAQWLSIKKDLENTSAKHIILMMSKNPLTQFDDMREGKAFHDYLKAYKEQTGKTIFVVTTGGIQKEVRIEDGIRYIRLNGLVVATDDPKQGEYLRFKVVGDQVYYTFESIM